MASGLIEKAQIWCLVPAQSSSLILLMILLLAGEEEKEHGTGK